MMFPEYMLKPSSTAVYVDRNGNMHIFTEIPLDETLRELGIVGYYDEMPRWVPIEQASPP